MTNMKSNELRIGNLILWKGIEVKKVDANIIARADLDPEGFNMNYKPIPLKDNWLLKFGFEHIHDDLFKLHITESVLLIVNLNILSKDIAICINNQRFYIAKKYVHQLQNLYFSLTGKELKEKQS